ncbi:hypothetical protein M1D39_10825 [Pseudomonas sp. D2-5]
MLGSHLPAAVVHVPRHHTQSSIAAHLALTVIQLRCIDSGKRLGTERATLIVQALAGLDLQLAIADQAAGIAHLLRLDAQIRRRAAVVGPDAGLDQALVDHLPRLELNIPRRSQALLHLERTLRAEPGLAGSVDLAGQRHLTRLDGQVASGRGLRQAQLATGIDPDLPGTGGHIAGQFHADTGFGTHQTNRPGIHAAQGRAVDGQLRLLGAVVGLGGGLQGGHIDLVATGDDVQPLGVDLGVDLRAAGDQVELVDVAGIEASAFDGDVAAVDVEALQAAIVDHRRAGAQRRPRGVDKAAAVAGDAVGVGDDHVRCLPGHFRVALELAAVAAGHFVEDDAGGSPLQVGVANDDAALLGALQPLGGIVEDQPLLADVVVGELVVRQAAAIGRGDIDDGHAIAGLVEAGIAAGLGINRQLRRGGDDRIEEHHAGKDQGYVLEKRAADVHVRVLQGVNESAIRRTGRDGNTPGARAR